MVGFTYAWSVFACFASAGALIDCDNVVRSSDPFTGACNNKWTNLKPLIRPTQVDVGYAWITRKLKNYGSQKDAQADIDDNGAIPAVLGPNNTFFITDSHHTLGALDWSGFSDVSVELDVKCDYRSLDGDAFWAEMEKTYQVWLLTRPANKPNALPTVYPPSELPTRFSFTKGDIAFKNDNWRSLAGLSRKHRDKDICSGKNDDKYCARCFIRNCDEGAAVPFIEFAWAYYFDERYNQQSPLLKDFKAKYDGMPAPVMGDIDWESWLAVADLLIPLCRSEDASDYTLSKQLFPRYAYNNYHLPGATLGESAKLPADPSCNTGSCPSALH